MDQQKTVLVIDDDLAFQTAVAELLRLEGYLVLTASDCAGGWDVISEQKPEVLVLDWNMPGSDGISLLRRMRSSPDPNHPYTIMVTARSDSADVVRGIREGADDYLRKPFDNAELIARVGVGVRTRELERQLAEQTRKTTVLEMAGAVAHEIGNPLAAAKLLHLRISQNTQVAGSTDLAREVGLLSEELQRIENLVRRAQAIGDVRSVPYAGDLKIVDLRGGGEAGS
jgi:DNA-binding response OmpR family regulator